MEPVLLYNGRLYFGVSYADLLRKQNSLAGSIPVDFIFNSRLGRISDEYSRLASLNNYRMLQIRARGFAGGLDHTALTAHFSNVVTAGVGAGLFGSCTNLVLTKGTFGGNYHHPLVTGRLTSDPMVGISEPSFFRGDITQFTNEVYGNRLAFQTTGDALLQAALIRPLKRITSYSVEGSFVKRSSVLFDT